MNAIEKAREARAEQALEKKINLNGRIITKKEFIKELIKEGYKPKEGERNRINYNRIHFNRMNGREQEEYLKKCDEKIPCFLMKNNEGCYYEISKAEFNYALSCTH